MTYNVLMADAKQKFALWLSEDQAEKFETVYKLAKTRDKHTNWSEVIKQLMGFAPSDKFDQVIFPEDRETLSRDTPPKGEHGPSRPAHDLGAGKPVAPRKKKEA